MASSLTLTVISYPNKTALIIIATIVGLIWTLLVSLIRLYIRLRLNGPLGLDDAAASLATVFGLVQATITLVSVHDGLGMQQDLLLAHQVDAAMRNSYVASLLYIAAICSSKCSMFLLIARLSQKTRHLVVSYGMTCFTVSWAVVSLLIIAFQCSFPQPWNVRDRGRCPTLVTRWIAIEILSMLIEYSISVLAIALVWDLAMAFRTKAMVVFAFSVQLLVVVPILFRLKYVRDAMDASEFTYSAAETTIATQVVLHFSIMAATFPCFRQFLQAFDSGLGATTKIGARSAAESGRGLDEPFVLPSLDYAACGGQARLRPDPTANISTEVAGNPHAGCSESMSLESVGSDKAIWRTRKWEIRYEAK